MSAEEKKKRKIGLIPRLLIAIVLGALLGSIDAIPDAILQIPVTFTSIFSDILDFFIPLMIVGFIVKGIADLTEGAGALLAITTGMAYASTIISGFLAFVVASILFPLFIDTGTTASGAGGGELEPLFEIPIEPMFEVTTAILFAFMFGIAVSWLRSKKDQHTLYHFFSDFNETIMYLLENFIVPLLPFFIFGNFINLGYTGEFFSILNVFWRVFLIILALHFTMIVGWFIVAGTYTGKNPFTMMKNQAPAYTAALGLQSSAASIPFSLVSAEKNGVSQKIREFVIPFCANAHLMGSISTIVSCVIAVLMIYDMPYNFATFAGFIFVLGIAMVAAPGAPGGAIIAALPFLPILGIDPSGGVATLLVSLYITQDSFGTACNITGDNAMAVIVDKIYHKRYSTDPDETIDPVQE